jgi:hypothetical protein
MTKKRVTRLNLVADYDTEVGYHDRPGDGTPYSGYSHTVRKLSIHALTYGVEFDLEEDVDVCSDDHVVVDFPVKPGDHLLLVVVRYYDGCTFSCTSGYHALAGAFRTQEEARARAQAVRDRQYPNERWKPGDGYFAGLEDVEIVPVTVLPA